MMRRHRLGVVLRLAELQERGRLVDFALARQASDAARERLRDTRSREDRTRRLATPAPGSPALAAELSDCERLVKALAARAAGDADTVRARGDDENAAREVLAQARLRRLALERAIERREQRTAQARRRRENRAIDELVRARRTGGMDDA